MENESYEYSDEQLLEQEVRDQALVVNSIIAARERYGLDPGWIAERAGYSLTQYNKIENGERKLTYADALRIGGVIADYAETLETPLQRAMRQARFSVRRHLYDIRIFLEDNIPGCDRIFAWAASWDFRETMGFIILALFLSWYIMLKVRIILQYDW